MSSDLLRRLPQIEKALRWPGVAALVLRHGRAEVTRALREALDVLRARALGGQLEPGEEAPFGTDTHVIGALSALLRARTESGYRRVINGSGVILHTGLGRAVLPTAAREALSAALSGYGLVEIDPESGARNRREDALQGLLRETTGAEAGIVVNNNAAATLLILAAMARGREVIVSRGQLVEIGGSFRIPDILAESGAKLVEVGTTNRTYIEDYRKAVTSATGLLLLVHTSNYAIRGFARHTPLAELVGLGREIGIPVVSDLGSGCFVDLKDTGFEPEPLVSDSVREGADLVCFSGDKMLGGPQAGLIVGRKEAVERARRHPLYRALRVSRATLCMLEATLRLHRDPEAAREHIPALRAALAPADAIGKRAVEFRERIAAASPDGLEIDVEETTAEMGSGALPDQSIPSHAIALRDPTLDAEALARKLRRSSPPVIPRIRGERVLIDFRTLLPGDEDALAEILLADRSGP